MSGALPLVIGATVTGALWAASLGAARRPRRVPTASFSAGARPSTGGVGAQGAGEGSTASATRAGGRTAAGLIAGLGGAARRAVGRAPEPDADRRAGAVIVVALVLLLVSPLASVLASSLLLSWPVLRRRRVAQERHRRVVDELPDVIDLLRIAVDGGLTVHDALVAVVAHGDGDIVDALAAVLARVDQGDRLGDALPMASALGPAAQGFVDTLVAAERYGTSAARELDRAATEARIARRRRGEESARRVPVKMLFPLVLCTLPALGLLTVLPLLARSLPSLAP